MHGTRTTVVVALAANLVIALAKGVVGLLTGSTAALAETAHSIADTANQGFLLVSLSLGRREPDESHPFGYGKERFLWAFVAAIFIFVAGAVFSFARGLAQLLGANLELLGGSHGPPRFWLLYLVFGIAFLAEGTSLVRALRQTLPRARESGRGLLEFVRRSKEPTTKTVLYEDTAAVAGILVGAGGVALHQLTGSDSWEAVAALVIGALLMGVAVGLFRDTKGLVIGEAAPPEDRRRIREIVLRHDEVVDLLDLRTMYVGPETLLVAARVDLRDDVSGADAETVSTAIDEELKAALPDVREVFLDATARRRRNGGGR